MLLVGGAAIFLTWFIVAAILVGIGYLALAPFRTDSLPGDAFWMWLSISAAVLEVWSLILPVTASVTLLLFALGVAGLARSRANALHHLSAAFSATNRAWIVVAAAAAFFLAIRACAPCDYTDTGLYGAQAVRWATTQPAIPGLANLHGRLGFNSSVFLYIAALEQGPWRDRGHHLFTGLLMAALCVAVVPACFRLVRRLSGAPSDWFYGILAIPLLFWVTRSKIVGTLTDEPAAIACLAGAGILVENLCARSGGDSRRAPALAEASPSQPRLVVAATVFALAVSFKLSTVVFAFLAWCLAFRWLWSTPAWAGRRKLNAAAAAAFSAMILLPLCARGIILSGYPLYPSTVLPAKSLGIHADWQVPAPLAQRFAAGVRSFGRDPDATQLSKTQGSAWFGPWLNHTLRNRVGFQVPAAISLAGLGAGLAAVLAGGTTKAPLSPWLWLLLPSAAGVTFWFVAAPDLRFAQFAIWTGAGIVGTWGIVSLNSGPWRVGNRAILTALALLGVWCMVSFGWQEPYRALLEVEQIEPMPKPHVVARRTASGLEVFVPSEGSNCWDAPLPCTAYFDKTLRLRDLQSMRWGFASEGRQRYMEDEEAVK